MKNHIISLPAADWQRLGTWAITLPAFDSEGAGPCLLTVGMKWAPWQPAVLTDPPALYCFLSGTGSCCPDKYVWNVRWTANMHLKKIDHKQIHIYQNKTHCLLCSFKENNHVPNRTSKNVIFVDMRSNPNRKLAKRWFSSKSIWIFFYFQ